MRVGVPTEIKNNENRVALTPAGVHELVRRGHEVVIQEGAGIGARITDADYVEAGGTMRATAEEIWAQGDLLLKVKEPIAAEYPLMRRDQVLFTYLHLAPAPALTQALLASGTTGIAYETVQLEDRSLPLLAPMSEVAGRMSVQVGGYHLMRSAGGRGALLGGVSGTKPAKVVVIGGGVAGEQAATMAVGMHADVTIFDISAKRLRDLDARFDGRVHTLRSSAYEIAAQLTDADLVIGSVLVPGASAPKLVTDAMVRAMKPGAVLVDIAIDQGGCFEHAVATTHDEPVYPVHNTLYYCVAIMPGAAPVTSTEALTNASLPYALAIAEQGWRAALAADPALARGLNVYDGRVTNPAVAAAQGLELLSVDDALAEPALASVQQG